MEGVLGSYRIVKKLGEGGMGAVYLAEHALLGRPAAVKVLHPAMSANQDIVQRFFNEARAATAIADPGIVQIFDFGYHTDGSAFIVMEFLEGEALESRLRRLGRLAPEDALRILRQVAASLGAAHGRGIIHRDLKPDNIFLVPDREVAGGERAKILDFGIAKLTGDTGSAVKTQTTAIMGTPMYMSPEQCRGAGHVDHRSDIYSLGCVLYHLVAGRVPFDGDGVGEIIAAHLREPPPTPSHTVPGTPPAVDELVLRCMAKDPAVRYQTAAELAQACDAVLGGAGVTGAPMGGSPTGGHAAAAAPSMSGYPGGAPSVTTLSGAAGAQPTAGATVPPASTGRRPGLGIALGAVGVVAAAAVALVLATGGKKSSSGQPPTDVVAPLPGDPAAVVPTPGDPGPAVPLPGDPAPAAGGPADRSPVAVAPALPAAPVAVVFAVDASTVGRDRKAVLAAVHDGLAALPDDALVGLVSFAAAATVDAPLAVIDRGAVDAALAALASGRDGELAVGLDAARAEVARAPAGATRHVVLIAGGADSGAGLDAAVGAALGERVKVSTFGVNAVDRAALKRIAAKTDGRAFDKVRASDLARTLAKEFDRLQGKADGPVTRPGSTGSTRPTGSGTRPSGGTTTTDPKPAPKPDPKPSTCAVPGDLDCDGIPDQR